MTDNNHPITPPPELVREWNEAAMGTHFPPYGYSEYIATQAASWGADRQLEQCVDWVNEYESAWLNGYEREGPAAEQMRNACRPKSPSLKAQALEALKHAEEGWRPIPEDCALIRRALESLTE